MRGPPPRARPPWWPQGEAWPPPAGHRGPSRLIRRLFLAGLAFFILMVILSGVSGFFFADRDREGPPPFAGFFLLLIVGGAFFLASRVARRFTNPVDRVLTGLERLAAGDYSVRVTPEGPPPMRALAESLNMTAARLEAAEGQRRALVADIAHEVRNPLAVIRGNVEGMLDGLYPADATRLAPVLDEVALIARLVEDLSTLSSAEAGVLLLHKEAADVAELLVEVAAASAAGAAARGASISAAPSPPILLLLDPHRFRQVLENLVANALAHTGAGGSVSLSATAASGRVSISVSDTGSGIPPEDLPFVFERYRKSADSSGSGLGLAIARRLVEAHGGTIEANSEPGEGTTITISLPTPV